MQLIHPEANRLLSLAKHIAQRACDRDVWATQDPQLRMQLDLFITDVQCVYCMKSKNEEAATSGQEVAAQ
jgi:hypothetical protein